MIPSNPKLEIKFNEYVDPEIYLLSKNEHLNQKSFKYREFAFRKKIVNRLKSRGKCVDYEETHANCTTRSNCLERCINQKFMAKYKRTPIGSGNQMVIDKDWFSEKEWNKSRPMESVYNKPSKYLNISRHVSESCQMRSHVLK